MHRKYVKPISVGITAVAAAAFAQAIPDDGVVSIAVRVVAGLLLVFVLPGFAVVLALGLEHRPGDQLHRTEGKLESWTWAVAISIALAVGGAFLLNALPAGLTRTSWTALLTASTVVAVLIALVREAVAQPLPKTVPAGQGPVPDHDLESGRDPARRKRRRRGLVMLISACVIGGVALGIAGVSEKAKSYPGFTQLWLVSARGGPGPGAVRMADTGVVQADLGVRNFEQRTELYRLTVNDSAGRLVQEWSFQLQPEESWHTQVSFARGQDVEATLHHDNDPEIYRRVTLQGQ